MSINELAESYHKYCKRAEKSIREIAKEHISIDYSYELDLWNFDRYLKKLIQDLMLEFQNETVSNMKKREEMFNSMLQRHIKEYTDFLYDTNLI